MKISKVLRLGSRERHKQEAGDVYRHGGDKDGDHEDEEEDEDEEEGEGQEGQEEQEDEIKKAVSNLLSMEEEQKEAFLEKLAEESADLAQALEDAIDHFMGDIADAGEGRPIFEEAFVKEAALVALIGFSVASLLGVVCPPAGGELAAVTAASFWVLLGWWFLPALGVARVGGDQIGVTEKKKKGKR